MKPVKRETSQSLCSLVDAAVDLFVVYVFLLYLLFSWIQRPYIMHLHRKLCLFANINPNDFAECYYYLL